jgi:hypothetical protein
MSFDASPRIGPGAGWYRPGRSRRKVTQWTTLALAALVGVAALWWFFGPFGSLQNVVLAGDRGPGCVRIVEVVDESGSMQQYAPQRAVATSELQQWVSTNLRGSDELAVIEFADHTQVTRRPASIQDRTPPAATDLSMIGSGTVFAPALQTLQGLPRTVCRTELLVISDGEISDPPAAVAATDTLTALGVDRVRLFNPVGDSTPAAWTAAFPFSQTDGINAADPDEIALAFGKAIADVTGQHLARAS